MLVAPERRMSSWVITKMAAAVRATLCSVFETETTLMFIRSSRLWFVRSTLACCAPAGATKSSRETRNAAKVRGGVAVRTREVVTRRVTTLLHAQDCSLTFSPRHPHGLPSSAQTTPRRLSHRQKPVLAAWPARAIECRRGTKWRCPTIRKLFLIQRAAGEPLRYSAVRDYGCDLFVKACAGVKPGRNRVRRRRQRKSPTCL